MPQRLLLAALACLLGLSGRARESDAAAPADLGYVAKPEPRGETEPSGAAGDTYDDPAVWVHPTDPALSLVIGSNKKGGLHVFDLAGRQLGVASPTACPNNVDVLPGFSIRGRRTDVAVAACREKGKPCVRVWAIDPATRRLADVSGADGIPVFGGEVPYGSCTYHSPKTGKFYFFVNNKSGQYEQHVLGYTAAGAVTSAKVREFKVSSVAEGCVADPATGALYVSEEDVGLWRFSAEEDGGAEGKLVAKVGEHGLTADCEGVTIYDAGGGKGYVVLSSQGNNTFKLYERDGANAFVGTITPAAGKLGTVSETDGVAATGRPLGPKFPHGMLVVQDGTRRPDGQRFKFYAWEDVAGAQLRVAGK
ncbi:3-phytase : 3-phytase (Myo-inositol-hexaphosphate 3-phosphohydrolase) OS=Singulisphaera acidiphila (strain ATCC BAA-1392 / DSM 18658 / VKM B-2454 / MOB10) GN=Sinac_3868 PE=4 SV=1: Phytase [Gemmataceae bacterium]|nr:3-phytase : 3-phytase (Myo-inositol-hexaphosphate 3-phosphohydrolase) OS=Singulisphaera acidiphila (strain ATCC BAA-1392 / DSM 18658 / VKM B-2454 / MOB10) GN=Sinac_3868 PE=4 SV=1: Phytase [Gemmataceae bacterium]VTU00646.1 3-phytase : 3-phytase (Myo-inositol-hexaphosphate 3-phosphohydrolase) OS=Singulisphaera acidiphila (strain ATCC BAA-1392 / DSM 18658 / VKM B-2454 / MOB10) GN=Sinac_3868 PE=4 SV=1: Phytase [Gemmataceae bacterium]